ncbi:unnamed protein product [Parajaminaea phylloscopi]
MSVYVPPAASDGTGCTGACGSLYDQEYQYLSSYFTAHMLSYPSHRYAYLMWFVIVGSLLLFSALHHLGIGDKTWVGAYWTKFAPKSRIVKVGKKPDPLLDKAESRSGKASAQQPHHTGPQDGGPKHMYPPQGATGLSATTQPKRGVLPSLPRRRYIYTFPSFGSIILVAVMIAVPVTLALVGADYVRPSASMFDLRASWPNATDARYGYYGKRTEHVVRLAKRLQWGIGTFSPISTTAATYSIPYHTWWTIGGRFGLMTNALTPFVLILALKQVPWAVVSLRVFGSYSFEHLSFLHKWGGRLLVAFALVHTVTWSIQLSLDEQFGRNLWSFVFIWTRFRWAFVSIGFLVLLAITSIGPIRQNYYEFFYISHIVCIIGFMVAAALHHPPLAGWMWASLTWWAAERVTRAIKVAWVNGIGFAGRKPQQALAASGAPRRQLHKSPYPVSRSSSYFQSSSHPTAEADNGPFGPSASQMQSYHEGGPRSGTQLAAFTPPSSLNRHTATTSSSSATLYDGSSTRTAGLRSQQSHRHPATADSSRGSDTLSPSRKPAFLEQDPLQQATGPRQLDDEWELDDNGDKVRRRPSQRYGPVSDLIKEYAAGTKNPMADIGEDDSETTPSHTAHTSSHAPHGDQSDVFAGQQDIGSGGFTSYHGHGEDENASYWAHGDQPSSSADHYAASAAQHEGHTPTSAAGPPPNMPSRERRPTFDRAFTPMSLVPHEAHEPRPALPADVAALIKPGYAFAQVLPGKTLRLTLRTPNRMSWYPGQWLYLNTPAVRGWQSHPFSIASAYDAAMPIVTTGGDRDLEKGLAKERRRKGEERTVVLLLRARKGFTLQLWDYVRRHRHRQVMAAAEAGEIHDGMQSAAGSRTTTGVHIRAIVDGAYGTTQRVRWGIHSSIVIVCGGSGVTFGISLLEHLCNCMTQRNLYGQSKRGGKDFEVKRVRFVWILREFAHLQWISSALRRCIEMVPPEQLRVDLYVTHFNNVAAWTMTGGGRMGRSSSYDMLSSMSRPGTADAWQSGTGGWQDAHGNVKNESNPAATTHRLMEGGEADDLEIGANDLTEFEGEDMAGPSAAEQQINTRIQREGKLRRAHTRKATLRRKTGRPGPEVGGPERRYNEESHTVLAQQAMYDGRVPMHINSRSASPRRHSPSDERGMHGRRNLSAGDGLRVPLDAATPVSALGTPLSSMPGTPAMDPRGFPGDASIVTSPFMGAGGLPERRGSYTPFGAYASSMTHSTLEETYAGTSSHGHRKQPTLGSNSLAHQSHLRLLSHDAAAVAAAADEVVDMGDCPIDLDEEEDLDLRIIAELAHPGHPRLDRIIEEEVRASQGRVMVAGCGPTNLGALLRRIVAKHIDPAKARKGDKSGQINLCIESFEWGGS